MRLRSFVCTLVMTAAPAWAACAQGTTGPAVLYALPGSHELATVAQGTALDQGEHSGEFVRVNLRGFIATSLLGAKHDSFPVTVNASGARLRAAPSATAVVVADVQLGMGFAVVKRAGAWTEVQRSGWIRRSAFPAALAQRAVPPAAAPKRPESPPPAAASSAADTASPPVPGAETPDKSAGLSAAPGVAPVASIQHGAVLVPIARDRGWVRVRLEGWVRESDLVALDSSVARLTAADLRANPDQYVGQLVRWTVTSLAFQTADPLRKDMRPDEPYLLARGPGSENALLYLALPAALVDRAKALGPLTQLVVTARVRTGRADPTGVPILDVQSMTNK